MSMKHYYQNQIVFEKSESRCTAQFLKIVTPSHVAEWAVVNRPMSEYTSTSPATAHRRHNHPRHRFPAYLLETYATTTRTIVGHFFNKTWLPYLDMPLGRLLKPT